MKSSTLRGSLFLIKIAIIVMAAILIAQHPGEAVFTWFGYRIEMTTGVFLAVALLFMALFFTIANVWRAIWRLPVIWAERRQKRSERKGLAAMIEGMTAVAAGELQEARRQTKRAESYHPTHPMTGVLAAQAAFLAGKTDEAKSRFLQMTRTPSTSFLGYRGLSLLARQSKDWENLRTYLHNALALRPNSPWVMHQLMDMDLRLGFFDKAAMIVEQMQLRQLIDKKESRRRQALIHWMQADRARAEGNEEGFSQTASSAHYEAPEVTLIAVELAKYYAKTGRESKAIKTLTQAYGANPHAELGMALQDIKKEAKPLDAYKEMETLTSAAPDHAETHYLLSKAALDAKLWGQARQHAESLKTVQYSQRVARLFAEIEESEHPYDPAKAHEWWERASVAPSDPTWLCQTCHTNHKQWHPICPACGQFDQISWASPMGATTPELQETPLLARMGM